MAVQPPKLHGVKPRENLDRAVFIGAFLFGVIGGVILKIMGAHAFITMAYAAIVLIIYATSAWAGGRIEIESEAVGDNCYYLGFLFTLTSLSFTLYQMADPAGIDGRPIHIPEVISGFGVALSSTIIGVFLRVLLMQIRPDFVATDRAVRADLNVSFADFRKNLSGILSQMKAFSTESIQFASERDARLRESTEKFVADHQQALLDAADTLAKNMETKFSQAARQSLKEITASVQEAQKDAKAAIHELVLEVAAIKTRLSEQEAQTVEEISNRRKPIIAELAQTEEKMHSHNDAMASYTEATQSVADVMVNRIIPALDALEKRLEEHPRDAMFESVSPQDLENVVDKPFTVTPSKSAKRDSKGSST